MAEPKQTINRTAQIFKENVTIDDITDGATQVGAPSTATISTGFNGSVRTNADGQPVGAYMITYAWTEEV